MKTSPIAIRAQASSSAALATPEHTTPDAPGTAKTSRRPKLWVVDAPVPKTPKVWIGAFAGILLFSLVTVLLVNILVSNRQYEIVELNAEHTKLTQENETLSGELSNLSSPQNLAQQAADMGMVLPGKSASIDLDSGKVTGTAEPADKENTPTDFVESPTVPSAQGVPAQLSEAERNEKRQEVTVDTNPVEGPPVNSTTIGGPDVEVPNNDTAGANGANAGQNDSQQADLSQENVSGPEVELPQG